MMNPNQLHLPLGVIPRRAPAHILPRADILARADGTFLASVLHHQGSRGLRHGSSVSLLHEMAQRRIEVADIILPYRPDLSDDEVDHILPTSQRGHYSADHRRLILHAHILARSLDREGEIQAEMPISPERHAPRPDVMLTRDSGELIALEAGAIDGSRIETLLWTARKVIVLPYAGLHYPVIAGYAFSSPEERPLQVLTGSDGRRALATLTDNLGNHQN